MWSDLSAYPVCLLESSYMASVTALLCSLQKSASNGGKCMSISIFMFCVPFHTMAVKLHLTLVFVTPLQINFMSKIFSIPFLFGLTAVRQFIVLVCKLSEGDENKIIHVQIVSHIFIPCTKFCYSSMCSCHGRSNMFPVFACTHSHIVSI